MGVAPDLSTKVDSRENGRGIYPNVVEDVGSEGSDKGKGVGVEVGNTRDVAEEVAIDKFLLGYPKLLPAVVNDCVLVRVAVAGEGTGGGGEEIGEDVG